MSLYLSKSKYTSFYQCPKMLWLRQNKPEEEIIPVAQKARMIEGNIIGDMAMGLFGDFLEVTEFKADNPEKLDLPKMIENTEKAIKDGVENICEASFSYNGLYCAVDILKKEKGGYAIYEVKSSTEVSDIYIVDVSYQKYVLEHCGINVTGAYIVHINNQYVYDGNLNLSDFFTIEDIFSKVINEQQNVQGQIDKAEEIMSCDKEPEVGLHIGCNKPYACNFWKYCTRNLPSPSVFDLYGTAVHFDKKLKLLNEGYISFDDLKNKQKLSTSPIVNLQLKYYDKDEPYIDKQEISKFLDTLSYPLYFLDFETMQPVIPEYIGTKPYQQIPFQYSLHYIESENGELKHKEFLGISGEDPRRACAEQLCEDIPADVCVTAYNMGFECSRLKELADTYPDLSVHLLAIRNNMKDFLVPFRKGYCYNHAMGASFSIKSVLPALFPDDPELDYHSLEEVHNGTEAMTVFPKIKDMPPEQQEITRKNLLKYCELDTYAMVKVWQKLIEFSKK